MCFGGTPQPVEPSHGSTMTRTILITGGAGFIGSTLVRRTLADLDARVVNVDKLTYASNPDVPAGVADDPRYALEVCDIQNRSALRRIFATYGPEAVIHLAAESHVDRSIDGPEDFIQTNLVGTYCLLEETRRYWNELPETGRRKFRFLHVSTDEVFGSLEQEGHFSESSPYRPNSPYAATKAGSDHLVRAWHRTFGLPVVVTHSSNNFGPFQFPEKLIPLAIIKALRGESIPVYGDGRNVRDWIYVDDHARGLLDVLEAGTVGESYNIGGDSERRNIDVVTNVCEILDRMVPDAATGDRTSLVRFVPDRPGHDFRYAIDSSKIRNELGWRPGMGFEKGLRTTVQWYVENREWWEGILSARYRGDRLGLPLEET